jgi:rRNA processing protein Krr1/Pno1
MPEEDMRVPRQYHAFLIGPRFAQLNAIQEATNTRITVPGRETQNLDFTISGNHDDINTAKRIITDLIEKGYSRILSPETVDSHIFVPVDKRFQILGPGGAFRKAVEQAFDVKVRVPERSSDETRVYIVGLPGKVKEARRQIKYLLQYSFCETTHPGWTKIEMDFPKSAVGLLVGHRGQKIKSLQAETKCKLMIPDYINQQKLIIAGPKANVNRARTLVGRILNPPQPEGGVQEQDSFMDDNEESGEEDTSWARPPEDLSAFTWDRVDA